MIQIGDRVRIASDNENYDSFRESTLVITHIANNEDEHMGYDSSMGGEPLMDFETEEGEQVPFSLYGYEIEYI